MKKKIGGAPDQNSMDIAKSMMGIFFRYIPLISLYAICLFFLFNNATQYILFICLLVLSIFGTIFIIRDLFTIEQIYSCIFGIISNSSTVNCDDSTSNFLKLFMFSLVIGCFSQIISLSIIISVFDYGRQKFTQNFIVKQMSGFNQSLLYNFKQLFILGSAVIIILAYFIAFSHGLNLQMAIGSNFLPFDLMRKIGCSLLSLAILCIAAYEIYLSTQFLKVKQHNAQLYIVT